MTDERYRDDLEHEIEDLQTEVREAENRESDLLKQIKIARSKKFAIFLWCRSLGCRNSYSEAGL